MLTIINKNVNRQDLTVAMVLMMIAKDSQFIDTEGFSKWMLEHDKVLFGKDAL